MKIRSDIARLACLLIVIMLAACDGLTPATPTSAPTAAALPPTAAPTASPIPPTATPTDTPVPTPEDTPTPSAISYGPNEFPAQINPLTGLPVTDPQLLERRPLSVKVQIFPRGQRPPMGVSQADIVYDYYQNNGMTRFHAVFYSQDAEQVGPIRSARLFDSNVVRMYKSVLAFGGADRRIMSVFLSSEFADRLVVENSFNCPPMCRIDPNGYNFLVTNTSELSKYITTKGVSNDRQDLNGTTFHSTVPEGGSPATQIFVRFSISAYARWDYDAAQARYLRSQDTAESASWDDSVYAPMIDKNNGQQLVTDNIIVLFLPHKLVYRSASGTSEIVNIDMLGSGPAFGIRDGLAYQLTWSRADKTALVQLALPDGSPYPLKPGVTWYEVIGQSSPYQDTGNGIWRFQFSIP
ncbi:MAG: DUF3048 domain-containing protein [Chloroflexota bacterium]